MSIFKEFFPNYLISLQSPKIAFFVFLRLQNFARSIKNTFHKSLLPSFKQLKHLLQFLGLIVTIKTSQFSTKYYPIQYCQVNPTQGTEGYRQIFLLQFVLNEVFYCFQLLWCLTNYYCVEVSFLFLYKSHQLFIMRQ